MVRILFLFVLVMLVAWAAKALIRDLKRIAEAQNPKDPVTDELVEDPVCKTYCAKTSAYRLELEGKTLYFCSPRCRDEFLRKNQRP